MEWTWEGHNVLNSTWQASIKLWCEDKQSYVYALEKPWHMVAKLESKQHEDEEEWSFSPHFFYSSHCASSFYHRLVSFSLPFTLCPSRLCGLTPFTCRLLHVTRCQTFAHSDCYEHSVWAHFNVLKTIDLTEPSARLCQRSSIAVSVWKYSTSVSLLSMGNVKRLHCYSSLSFWSHCLHIDWWFCILTV